MAAGTGYEVGPGGGFEWSAAAAGPRRYGVGGSTTATSGPVSKLGYQEREVRRRARQKRISDMIGPTPAVPAPVLRGIGQFSAK